MAHFGGRYVGTLTSPNSEAVTRDFPVADGVVITGGDFVYWDGSGRVTNASIATQRLIGCAVPNNSTVTGNSGGTVDVKVIVNTDAVYLLDQDNVVTTFAATHVGTYMDLTGATGAQLADTSSTSTSGSVQVIEYNPQYSPYESDTSMSLVVIAEHAVSI